MVDIALCSAGHLCPVGKTCKRNPAHYEGKIGKWQSWFGPAAAEEITEKGCRDFCPLPQYGDDIPHRKRRKAINSLTESEPWGV